VRLRRELQYDCLAGYCFHTAISFMPDNSVCRLPLAATIQNHERPDDGTGSEPDFKWSRYRSDFLGAGVSALL
jgi:hypothetical protein